MPDENSIDLPSIKKWKLKIAMEINALTISTFLKTVYCRKIKL